jgi:hypothetical protein
LWDTVQYDDNGRVTRMNGHEVRYDDDGRVSFLDGHDVSYDAAALSASALVVLRLGNLELPDAQ